MKEAERGRKRAAEEGQLYRNRRISRSRSYSSASVSTISTNLSRSPKRTLLEDSQTINFSQPSGAPHPERSRKRRRSSSTSSSADSVLSSSSYSGSRSPRRDDGRNTRRRRSAVSPTARGRDVHHDYSRPLRPSRSRDDSMDRSRIARRRISISSKEKPPYRSNGYSRGEEQYNGESRQGSSQTDLNARRRFGDDDPHGRSPRQDGGTERNKPDSRPPPPPARKERSLSPFSKRLALTQAMNMN